ncbi:unnamed protein product [Linum trigynum]|uniref:GRF-type domain-containing protein n=1 Tax=Linum trigynum TaxID=586398 RepID=A0AAV2GKN2_9ROSI
MSQRGASSSRSENAQNSLGEVACYHNAPCVTNRSRKSGRMFYGCPHWKDPSKNCKFFMWVEGAAVDEVDERREILRLEESLRLVEAKAERRKKERKIIEEELRRVNQDVIAIRQMFIVVVLLNALILVVMLMNRWGMY